MNLQPLKQKLIGIVEAAVMGGIANYEAGFLSPDFIAAASDAELGLVDKLKDAIAAQIPPLEACVVLHAQRVGPSHCPSRPLPPSPAF